MITLGCAILYTFLNIFLSIKGWVSMEDAYLVAVFLGIVIARKLDEK